MENEEGSNKSRRFSRKESEQLLAEYKASGQTQKKWCESRGIALGTLRYWLKREREDKSPFSLVPVQMQRHGAKAGLEVQVGGLTLQISRVDDVGLLAQLLKELRS